AGVDHLVHVSPVRMGFDNTQSLDGAARHPGRISVMARVDGLAPDVAEHVARLAMAGPVVGVRLTCVTPGERAVLTDDGAQFWQAMQDHGLAVSLYAPDMLPAISTIAKQYPGISIIIDHAGAVMAHGAGKDDRFKYWPTLFELVERPNVFIKAS